MRSEAVERSFLTYRRTGRADALGEVFDRLAPELLVVAARIAAPGVDAEDLVQRTFLTAIEKADQLDGSRSLSAWLLGILVHFAQAERRRPKPTDPLKRANPARGSLRGAPTGFDRVAPTNR